MLSTKTLLEKRESKPKVAGVRDSLLNIGNCKAYDSAMMSENVWI